MAHRSSPTKKRLHLPFAVATFFLGIVLGLVVAEFSLRLMVKLDVLDPKSRYVLLLRDIEDGSLYRQSSDPVLAYEFSPHAVRNMIRINSGGLRGREYGAYPPPGVTRVAVLGDSESVGLSLSEENTFSGSLERALNGRNSGKKYEVLDFGVPGYNINQKVRILQKALLYHPAVVIFYYVFNDPEPFPNGFFFDNSLLSRSYLYVLLSYCRELLLPSPYQVAHRDGSYVDYFQKLHQTEYFEACLAQLKQMGEQLRSQKIRFIVVIAPELNGFDDFRSYPHRNIHQRLRELDSPALTVHDPLEDLAASGYKASELWTNPFDCHKGQKANWIIGRSIAARLF